MAASNIVSLGLILDNSTIVHDFVDDVLVPIMEATAGLRGRYSLSIGSAEGLDLRMSHEATRRAVEYWNSCPAISSVEQLSMMESCYDSLARVPGRTITVGRILETAINRLVSMGA